MDYLLRTIDIIQRIINNILGNECEVLYVDKFLIVLILYIIILFITKFTTIFHNNIHLKKIYSFLYDKEDDNWLWLLILFIAITGYSYLIEPAFNKNSMKNRVLIYKFVEEERKDNFQILTLIREQLKTNNSIEVISRPYYVFYEKEQYIENCLYKCNADMIIWGNYSEHHSDSLIVNFKYLNNCAKNIIIENQKVKSFSIPMSTKNLKGELSKVILEGEILLTLLSNMANDRCLTSTLDTELIEKINNLHTYDLSPEWENLTNEILISYYIENKNYKKALQYAQSFSSKNGYKDNITYLYAYILYERNKNSEALEVLEKINNKNAIYYNNRGVIGSELGNDIQAYNDLSKAIQIEANNNSMHTSAIENRGNLLFKKNLFHEAIQDYQQIAGNDEFKNKKIALSYFKAEDYKSSLIYLNKLPENSFKDSFFATQKCLTLIDTDNLSQAKKYCKNTDFKISPMTYINEALKRNLKIKFKKENNNQFIFYFEKR